MLANCNRSTTTIELYIEEMPEAFKMWTFHSEGNGILFIVFSASLWQTCHIRVKRELPQLQQRNCNQIMNNWRFMCMCDLFILSSTCIPIHQWAECIEFFYVDRITFFIKNSFTVPLEDNIWKSISFGQCLTERCEKKKSIKETTK